MANPVYLPGDPFVQALQTAVTQTSPLLLRALERRADIEREEKLRQEQRTAQADVLNILAQGPQGAQPAMSTADETFTDESPYQPAQAGQFPGIAEALSRSPSAFSGSVIQALMQNRPEVIGLPSAAEQARTKAEQIQIVGPAQAQAAGLEAEATGAKAYRQAAAKQATAGAAKTEVETQGLEDLAQTPLYVYAPGADATETAPLEVVQGRRDELKRLPEYKDKILYTAKDLEALADSKRLIAAAKATSKSAESEDRLLDLWREFQADPENFPSTKRLELAASVTRGDPNGAAYLNQRLDEIPDAARQRALLEQTRRMSANWGALSPEELEPKLQTLQDRIMAMPEGAGREAVVNDVNVMLFTAFPDRPELWTLNGAIPFIAEPPKGWSRSAIISRGAASGIDTSSAYEKAQKYVDSSSALKTPEGRRELIARAKAQEREFADLDPNEVPGIIRYIEASGAVYDMRGDDLFR